MAAGGCEAPDVDEFEVFRAQAMGCGAAVELTYKSDNDAGSHHHNRHHHVHHRRYSTRELISEEHSDSHGGSTGHRSHKQRRASSVQYSDYTPHTGQGGGHTQRDYLRSSRPTSDSPQASSETSPGLNLHRSHSCRTRRSSRVSTPNVDIRPDRSTPPDDNDVEQNKLSRNRNKTMPARRHQQKTSQSLAPTAYQSRRRSYQGDDVDEDDEDEECRIYRVRSFTTSYKGIVNKGDSFKVQRRTSHGSIKSHSRSPSIRSISNRQLDEHEERDRLFSESRRGSGRNMAGESGARVTPVITHAPPDNIPLISIETSSNNDATSHLGVEETAVHCVDVNGHGVEYNDDDEDACNDADNDREPDDGSIDNVLVLGSQEVGKTTLTQQLLTSEYLANRDTYQDDDNTDKIVSVVLDDDEAMVRFIDTPRHQSVDLAKPADAYVLVYSVTDRASFSFAQACLQDLRLRARGQPPSVVILVGNKQDSVRNRAVNESEGRRLATKKNCKFIEVSALLDHKVDELLVGIIRQIRLRQRVMDNANRTTGYRNVGCLHRAVSDVLRKIFGRSGDGTRSCENLMT